MGQSGAEALIKKVDCLRLYVKDLESGLAFYRDQLGLKLIWRTREEVGLGLAEDRTEIVLQTEKKSPEIDLKVESADAVVERIKQAGGTILAGPFDIKIGRCLVIRDPWDNELVLLDSSKGMLKTDLQGNVIGNLV